jgi:hypothetical protein
MEDKKIIDSPLEQKDIGIKFATINQTISFDESFLISEF